MNQLLDKKLIVIINHALFFPPLFAILHSMVIGEFSEAYPPLRDGVSEIVHDYVTGLREHGEECYAIVSGSAEGYEWDKDHGEDNFVFRSVMHVIRLISPYGYTKIRPEVKKKVESIHFDIVHAHSPFMLGRYAIKIAKKRNIPCIITFHSKYRDDIKRVVKSDFITNLVMRYVLKSFKMASSVWAVNNKSADVLRSYGFRGDIKVVSNFSNFKRHDEEETAILKKEGRAYLGLKDKDKVLLFVGQQREEKNLGLVIRSVKRLKDEGFDVKLVSVGSGPDSELYSKTVKDYGIEDRVIFTGTISDRSLLAKIYASADLFAFPSLYDNNPLVKMEAACFAVPSLLLEGATCTDGTINGQNAFYGKNDVSLYATKIKEILTNNRKRILVGKNAERDIYRSKDEAIEELIGLYKEAARK